MPVTFVDAHPAITEADLGRVEKQLKVKLPQAYRQFLLRQNGGSPRPIILRWKRNGSGETTVSRFLAVCDEPRDSLVAVFKLFKGKRNRIPDPYIPIALDIYGSAICIKADGPDGAIHYWDSDYDEEPHLNLKRIAGSIDEMLELFTDEMYAKPAPRAKAAPAPKVEAPTGQISLEF